MSFDKVDVSLLWRHISGFRSELGGLYVGPITGIGPLVGQQVNLNRIPSYDYFDLTTRFSVTVSAFNLLDKKPPLVGNQAGTTTAGSGNTFPSTYDVIGRRYSVTARLRF